MIIKKQYCDLCGKEITKEGPENSLYVWKRHFFVGRHFRESKIEVCNKCMDEIAEKRREEA